MPKLSCLNATYGRAFTYNEMDSRNIGLQEEEEWNESVIIL